MDTDIPKIKLIVIGDTEVGKTCILESLINNTFLEEYKPTIGINFLVKTIQIDNKDIKLLNYDTSGQEQYKSFIPGLAKESKIILLVYEITSKNSFLHLNDFLNILTEVKKEDVIFVLIGNKKDLEDKREVSTEEAEKFAKDNGYLFVEISAKTGDIFSQLFNETLVEKIKTKLNLGEQ